MKDINNTLNFLLREFRNPMSFPVKCASANTKMFAKISFAYIPALHFIFKPDRVHL